MATQVGIVKQTSGVVVAVDANGNERVLQAGDAIYLGEVVKTQGLGSNAVLSMDNGNDLSILENDTISVDQSTSDNTSFGSDAVADLSDLQRAILAGEDLSQLEETAAGGDTGAGGDGAGMLNDSVFAQGGHYSNVYADGRNLGSVGAGSTDIFRSLESDGGDSEVDIVLDTYVYIDVKVVTADGGDNIFTEKELHDGKNGETVKGRLIVGKDIVVGENDQVTLKVGGKEIGKATLKAVPGKAGVYEYTLENVATEKFIDENGNPLDTKVTVEYTAKDKQNNQLPVTNTGDYSTDFGNPEQTPDPKVPETNENAVYIDVKVVTADGGDNIFTEKELHDGKDGEIIKGTLIVGKDIVVDKDNDTIEIKVDGKKIGDAKITKDNGDGSYEYELTNVKTEEFTDGKGNKTGNIEATYNAKDKQGNTKAVDATNTYEVKFDGPDKTDNPDEPKSNENAVYITVELVTAEGGDNIITEKELHDDKDGETIKGKIVVGKDIVVNIGDPVTISVDGKELSDKATITKKNPDGSYEFELQNVATEVFTDGKGDKTGKIEATYNAKDKQGNEKPVTATNDYVVEFAPIVIDPKVVLNVSEEGLPDGIKDNKGEKDTTDSTTDTKTINVSSSGGAIQFEFDVKDGTYSELTSRGEKIIWKNQADGSLIGIKETSQETVLTVTLDKSTGETKVTLNKSVDHNPEGKGEDIVTTNVKIKAVNDAGAKAQSSIEINIEDDTPYVTSDSTQAVVVGFEHPKTNVTLVLDYSYSMLYGMNDTVIKGSEADTRLAVAKEGVLKLLDGYSIKGADNVKVNLVMFAGTAQNITKDGKTWLSVEEAKELINKTYTHAELTSAYQNGDKGYSNSSGINIKTGTNYDAALKVTMDSYKEDGKLSGIDVDNKLYFVSDGMPSVSDGYEGLYNYKAITTAEKLVWHNSAAYYPNGEDESGRFKFAYAGGTYSSGIRYIYFDKDGKWTDEYGRDITSDVKSDLGISASEEKTWRDWLEANQIDAEAFKLSEDASVPLLNPIAYNGSTKSDANAKDFSELALATRPTKGNFIDTLKPSDSTASGKTAIEYGADGDGSLHISVTLNTNQGTMTYVYSPTNNQYTVYEVDNGNRATSYNGSVFTAKMKTGSELTLDMSKGSYEYKPDASIAKSNGSETIDIKYSITDADGDKVEATTTLKAGSAVDYQKIVYGTANSDTLEGTTGNDVIAGGKGDDTIDGKGGADALLGGEGNDTIHYGKDAKILDGGEGVDTLVIKESIDFSKIGELDGKISNFEKLDLGKGGAADAVTLTIRAEDVLDITDNKNTILKIDGDSSDTIKGSWKETSDVKADGGYKAYEGTTEKGQTIYIQISDDVKTDFS
ncbi:retention module-containing protein [Campylobacter majalis]|uniref:retention module-containing protein n=1 Tax=Campylobacter majalis TaxID=2790656 RepID=UPI003D69A60D